MESQDGDHDGDLNKESEVTIEQELQDQDSTNMQVKVVEQDSLQQFELSECLQGTISDVETVMAKLPENCNGSPDLHGNINVRIKGDEIEAETGKELDVGKDEEREHQIEDVLKHLQIEDKNEPSPAAVSATEEVTFQQGIDSCLVLATNFETGQQKVNEIEKDADLLLSSENTHVFSDREDAESRISGVGNADGTMIDDAVDAVQSHLVASESATDGGDKSQIVLTDTKHSLIDITDRSGHDEKDMLLSQFPALDNVDLETDDEGLEGDRYSVKEGQDELCDDAVLESKGKFEEGFGKDNEETGHIIHTNGTRHESKDFNTIDSKDLTGDGDDNRSSVVGSRESTHRDFDMSHQNYEVCRELRPGVKACLVLETGEQFICVTKPKSPPDGSPDPQEVEVNRLQIQSDRTEEKGTYLNNSNSEEQDRFVASEAEDTLIESVVEDDVTSEPEVNLNNNNNQRYPLEEENTNENANSHPNLEKEKRRGDMSVRSSHYPSDRSYHAERGDYTQSYDRYFPISRSMSNSGSRNYAQSASRDSSYFDNRSHKSREDSSFYRSKDSNVIDSSQISSRYTSIERGDPRHLAAKSEPATIPKFKTLQDQQVNWLEMFKMIEQQHRTELQSQYLEHQKILQEMQKNMEKELLKQQDTLKQRLLTHKEMLEELSPGRQAGRNVNQSWAQNEADNSSLGSQKSALTNSTSHITLQGVPVALRNPPPITRYLHDTHDHKITEELSVKRSPEKEYSSPSRPADTSLSLSSHMSIDRDKQLRGGVYSSPMPLAKVKHKSPQCQNSHNTNSVHWKHDARVRDGQSLELTDVSLTESEESLSPRTRMTLREKHAKNVADLRAYYEKELRELRQQNGGGTQGSTAEDKIVASENQELRMKLHDLQDAYHDAKIDSRELQQKIQGLERRAADYAERYSAAQSQVLTLKSRLEELTDFAREKESVATDLENKNRKVTDSLQIAYKKEKELTETLHNAKNTIQKLVDKYETLEKDHDILKESLDETQEKLYSSRSEAVEVNNKMSRIELENKQLRHDMDNLKRDLTMARSAVTMHTSYEDAYHKTGNSDRGRVTYRPSQTARTRSVERPYDSHSAERQPDRDDISPGSESENDYMRSPLMKAERELKKLQNSPVYSPKLQQKFYGSEIPSSYSGPPITVDHTSGLSSGSLRSSKNHSPREKKSQVMPHGREVNARSSAPMSSYFSRSQVESSRMSRENEKNGVQQSYKNKEYNRNQSSPKKSSNVANGLTTDQAIERVKSGDILSRPAWEDVYTSLASGRPGNSESKGSHVSFVRDQMIRDRLQNIENLERKYEDLANEKRTFEAALSKLPGQGRGREQDRLESELDRVDRELGSVRMSLKRYHVLKSTI